MLQQRFDDAQVESAERATAAAQQVHRKVRGDWQTRGVEAAVHAYAMPNGAVQGAVRSAALIPGVLARERRSSAAAPT
jgi:hypothetical protein